MRDQDQSFSSTAQHPLSRKTTTPSNDIVYYYFLIAAIITIIFLTALLIIIIRKRYAKTLDDEHHSILLYPTNQQGAVPHFSTKEINFSLPPLRSTSLCDLSLDSEENDSLLMVSSDKMAPNQQQQQQRSNSFSCYGLGVIEPALYRTTIDLDEIQWPDGHIGRLWFSLRYEPSTEKLLVSLLKAKNLPSRTVGTVNSCDPFVRLHLMPDERRYLQSKQKKKTCNPYFDETLVFQVSPKDMSDHILKLSVIDGGRVKHRRMHIGHVTCALAGLELGDGTEQQLYKMDLMKEVADERPSNLGELLLALVYNENLCRLTVTVIEARSLKLQADCKRETYVRLTLNQHYRAVKEKRTALGKPADGSVAFNEGFNFKLAPSQVDLTSLACHVFQATSGYGRDKPIGKCVLGSYMFARGKALIQWNTAIANPMEQNQQWHTLAE